MPTILIVGGYGAVGRKIAQSLAVKPENRIVVAGRDLNKAVAFARQIGAEARQIDIASPATWTASLIGVELAIVCIDQLNTDFLTTISQAGIAYLDVTAGDHFFRQAELLKLETPALLSVGLAPGLSNLLAVAAIEGMDAVQQVDIGLLMGTGDEHGSAAIDWSTHQMFDPQQTRDNAIVDFGPDFGRRVARYMDFSDQHSLTRSMLGVKVVTRVAYDSRFLSSVLFWLGRQFAGNVSLEKLVARGSHLPTFGSDKCVLSVTVKGTRAGEAVARQAWFFGRREAAVTAAVASTMAELLLAGQVPSGVSHSHDVIDPAVVFQSLERLGHGRVEMKPFELNV